MKTRFIFLIISFLIIFSFRINIFSYDEVDKSNNIEGRWKLIKEELFFKAPELFKNKLKNDKVSKSLPNKFMSSFNNCKFTNEMFYWIENKHLDSTNYIIKADTLIFLGKEFDFWNSSVTQIISVKKNIMTINMISKEDNKRFCLLILKRQKK